VPPASETTPLLGSLLAGGADRPDTLRIARVTLSKESLLAAAAATAGRLPGDGPVAVDATATVDTVVAVVACLLAGVPAVPVAPDAGPVERDHLLADSGALAVLAGAQRLGHLAGDRRAVPAIPVAVSPVHPPPLPPEPPTDAPALILYTSGTTGPPKGVVLRRDAIAGNLDALAAVWEWSPEDVLVHGLPLFHVHGLVLGVLGALRVGSRLVHTGRPTPDAYGAAAAGGGSVFFAVPTVWSRLARSSHAPALRPARLLVSGSAALPAPVHTALADRCGQAPLERYGMTETLITLAVPVGGDRRAGTVGPPLPGVEARVVGDGGGVVPADGETVGVLQVRTPSLMDGYLGQPEATAAASTPDGWFVTGDAAVADPDGYVRVLGRLATDVIKTGGYRVGAGEVEAALLAHPGVAEAAVVGEDDADLGQAVVAYVVADGVGETELISWVAEQLSVHKRPRRVVVVGSLPRTPLGKVRKDRLVGPGRLVP
jgi:fatty acid CoA ligase FadD36